MIPRALATRNCLLRTGCVVKEVMVNDQGKATGVAFFDENDRLQEQPADFVVVSGGATESARLLLMSKSRLFPNGIGNQHDWVGRNLQGHTYTGANGYFPEDVDCYDDIGPGACIAVCDYNHGNEGLAGGGMLANEFIRLPIQFIGDLPRDTPRWGQAHKDAMRRYYQHNVAVQGPTQEIPVWDARVQLDPVVKDYWGLPVVRLSGGKHDHSIEIGNHQAERAAEWLAEAGAELRRAAPGRSRALRAPAPVRHLPHGRRPEDLGRRPLEPGPRHGQRLRGRRQRPRHQRRLQPRPHHHGPRLPGGGAHGEGVAGRRAPLRRRP